MVYSKAFEEELFYRFENRVDIRSLGRDFRRLYYAMQRYLGEKQDGVLTGNQARALADIADRRGFINIPITLFSQFTPSRKQPKRKSVSTTRRKWKRRAVRIPKVKRSVKYYVKRGYSANRIQRRLKKRGIGIRRKTLLRYVREAKKKPAKANSAKYTPRKYRRRKK
jgi:hypothetical protein